MNGRDPYYGFWELSRAETSGLMPLYYCIGTVLEAGSGRLRVRADGHELDEDDLYINAALRWDFEEEAGFRLGGASPAGQLTGYSDPCVLGAAHGSFTAASGYFNGTYKAEGRLRAGDEVLLIPSADRQTYYLVMKVVSVHESVSADQPAGA